MGMLRRDSKIEKLYQKISKSRLNKNYQWNRCLSCLDWHEINITEKVNVCMTCGEVVKL